MLRTLLCAVLLLVPLGCTTEEERSAALEVDHTDRPLSETWAAVMRVSSGEHPVYGITAPYVAEYVRNDSTTLELGPDPLGDETGRVSIDLYSTEGTLEATVEAERASYMEESDVLTSEGRVRVVLHGESPSEARARRLRSEGGIVTLSGGVRLEAEDGETLTTELVRYDREEGRLHAPGRFELRSATEWVRGGALDARADLGWYTFSNASGELEVHE